MPVGIGIVTTVTRLEPTGPDPPSGIIEAKKCLLFPLTDMAGKGSAYYKCVNNPMTAPAASLPDGYSGSTVSLKIRNTVTLTVNSSGACVFMITPSIQSTWIFNHTITTTTLTTVGGANSSDEYSSILANFTIGRPISTGVEVSYIGAESVAAGELIGFTLQGQLPASLNGTAIADFRDWQGAVSKPVPYMTKPLAIAASAFDACPMSTLSTMFTNSYPTIVIAGLGLPAGQTIKVEMAHNYELCPLVTSVHHHLARPSVVNTDDLHMVSRRLPATRTGTEGIKALEKPFVSESKKNRAATIKRKRTTKRAPARKYYKAKRKTAARRVGLAPYRAPRPTRRWY